jgi:glc operon protein GlcG
MSIGITELQAESVAQLARVRAAERGLRICVAVVDGAGDLSSFIRMQGQTGAAVMVCQAKARTSRLFACSTAKLAGLPIVVGQSLLEPVVLMPGGEPLLVDGIVVGAIGVSGASSDDDESLAAEAAREFETLLNERSGGEPVGAE